MALNFRKVAARIDQRAQSHVTADSRKTIKVSYFHFGEPCNMSVDILKKALLRTLIRY
jgi:hypothetical protein